MFESDVPNMFTERGYNRDHRINLQNMVDQIDAHKRDAIVDGRKTKGFDPIVWKMIRKYGSFTGEQALNLGLVDHLPKLCPLEDLIKSNRDEDSKADMQAKWGNETNVMKFEACNKINFTDYLNKLNQKDKKNDRMWKIHRGINSIIEQSSFPQWILSALGCEPPHYFFGKVSFILKFRKFRIHIIQFSRLFFRPG
jgi:ClpP class serine protease